MTFKGSRFLIAFVCLLGFTASLQAKEQSVQLEGETIKYSLPDGFCLLDPENQPFDKVFANTIIKAQKGINIVLNIIVSCEDLKQARSFQVVDGLHYSILMVPTPNGSSPVRLPSGLENSLIFNQIKPTLQQGASDVDQQEVTDRVNKALTENIGSADDFVKFDGIQQLGVLGEDADGLHAGLLISGSAAGMKQHLAAVLTYVPIKNYILTLNTYQPFKDKNSYVQLMERARWMTTDLVERN